MPNLALACVQQCGISIDSATSSILVCRRHLRCVPCHSQRCSRQQINPWNYKICLIHTICQNMAELDQQDICIPQARLARPMSPDGYSTIKQYLETRAEHQLNWARMVSGGNTTLSILAIFAAHKDGCRQFERWTKGTLPEKEWTCGQHNLKKTPVPARESGTGKAAETSVHSIMMLNCQYWLSPSSKPHKSFEVQYLMFILRFLTSCWS